MQLLHDNLLNTCLISFRHVSTPLSPPLLYNLRINRPPPTAQNHTSKYFSSSKKRMAETQQATTTQTGHQPKSHQVVKACTAVTAGGSLLVLSGLTLAGTVIALTVATPLLVIFSPVLVPAVITVALLITGFLASAGFGVAAITVLSWIYRYVTGRHPPGADQLEQARHKLAGKAREMREKAEHYGQQYTG